jgi:hypothetical protein
MAEKQTGTESIYRPENGSPVYWVWQDSSPAIETKFTDTGDITQWTPEAMLKRYGDPRAALDTDKAKMYFSEEEIARLKNDKLFYTHLRFPLDPSKPNLQGFVRTLSERGNQMGISEPRDPLLAFQQSQDIAATLLPQGENTPLFQNFQVGGVVGGWPNQPGDSTDPNRRTERKILGPYGPYEKVGTDGRTYYYFNPRQNRARDPWFEAEKRKEEEAKRAQDEQQQRMKEGSGKETGKETVKEGKEEIVTKVKVDELKVFASRVREALPATNRGGIPLNTLANKIRPLLDLIDRM